HSMPAYWLIRCIVAACINRGIVGAASCYVPCPPSSCWPPYSCSRVVISTGVNWEDNLESAVCGWAACCWQPFSANSVRCLYVYSGRATLHGAADNIVCLSLPVRPPTLKNTQHAQYRPSP